MYAATREMGANHYASIGLQSSIMDANPHRLVQMLMEGFIEKANIARHAMNRHDMATKGVNISKAIAILGGLKDGLNMDAGELSANLHELYSYMEKRLFEASAANNEEMVVEVIDLMKTLKDAWVKIPDLLQSKGDGN